MEQILVGNEGNVQQIVVTPELSELLKPSLLANMAIFDPDTLLLLVLTSKKKENGYSFDDLVNLLKEKGRIENNAEMVVERSLDVLLDSGFFSAEWKFIDNRWDRRFDNRNEVVKYLKGLIDDIVKPGYGFMERYGRISGRLLMIDSP